MRIAKKKRFLQNTMETIAHPQTKKEEGHLIAGYQEMSASQCSGKAGIQCLHDYPIFHFLFQMHD